MALTHSHCILCNTYRSIAGVILTPLLPTFERLLWRVCQGNVFIKHETISFGLFHPRDDVSYVTTINSVNSIR